MDLRKEQLYFVVKKYVGGKYWCFVNKKVVYDFFLIYYQHLITYVYKKI